MLWYIIKYDGWVSEFHRQLTSHNTLTLQISRLLTTICSLDPNNAGWYTDTNHVQLICNKLINVFITCTNSQALTLRYFICSTARIMCSCQRLITIHRRVLIIFISRNNICQQPRKFIFHHCKFSFRNWIQWCYSNLRRFTDTVLKYFGNSGSRKKNPHPRPLGAVHNIYYNLCDQYMKIFQVKL